MSLTLVAAKRLLALSISDGEGDVHTLTLRANATAARFSTVSSGYRYIRFALVPENPLAVRGERGDQRVERSSFARVATIVATKILARLPSDPSRREPLSDGG